MKCQRCLNEDATYFYHYKGKVYCRKCIGYGRPEDVKKIYPPQDINYFLDYELNESQKKASEKLLERYVNHQNTVLKAVCGAGKTEMLFEVIRYALSKGHKVCLTTPRKELVIDLAKRMQFHFRNIHPVVIYGGHTKEKDGQFVICTTHQLYRYHHCFDLMILDEFDAFPYATSDVLQNMFLTSLRGQYIMMSATIEQGDIEITHRFHFQDMPVPKCIVCGKIAMFLLMYQKVRGYKKSCTPVLVFVPDINSASFYMKLLNRLGIRSVKASSKDTDVTYSIRKLEKHEIDVIVTTTLLERGITLENLQVIIMHGENRVYNVETLIQIAGRVGRKIPYTSGDVLIYAYRKTKEINKCISQIKKDNASSVIRI